MNAAIKRARPGTVLALLVGLAVAAGGCHSKAVPLAGTPDDRSVRGTVTTSWGAAVAQAVVHLIPADAVPTTPITAASVLSGDAEAHDEPLEDLIRSPAAATYDRAATDASGRYVIADVDKTRRYFAFVTVDSADPGELYPGGDRSRVALSGAALDGDVDIVVTGRPPETATYVGSSTCLVCHPTLSTQKTHAHRLGFRKPGVSTFLQDLSRHTDFDDGLAFFKSATTGDFKTAGTSLWYHGYDGGRGFDKFLVSTTAVVGAEIRVYLWKEVGTGQHKVTMQNLATPGDSDRTYDVALTYGGAVYKQRYMLAVPGRKGRYPFLQYQHDGDDTRYERTRRVWRDYHMDFFWDADSKLFTVPAPSRAIESNCMACHATGYRYFDDTGTGERLCDAVDDPEGAFDIDGDGRADEINTGCEVCHGPGSAHVASNSARFIVQPDRLSPSRANQICGRCHDRQAGADDLRNDQPLDASGAMAPPGTSRHEFLSRYVSRKGPKLSSFWDDGLHSKSHHQQYSDFVKSAHYRNSRHLVVCWDCHDLHGRGAHDGDLVADPTNGALCERCHAGPDVVDHVVALTGSPKLGTSTSCIQCHYYKTAKTGAGHFGLLTGILTGGPSDANIAFWRNDISSHLTVVPDKNNAGFKGVTPGSAMPIPYSHECGTCHSPK